LGTNFSIYRATEFGRVFRGNQNVETFSIAKGTGLLGKVSFFAGVIVGARGLLIYSRNSNDPNAVHPAEARINTLMGCIRCLG